MNIALLKSLRNMIGIPSKYLKQSLYYFSKRKPSTPQKPDYHHNSQHMRKPILKNQASEPFLPQPESPTNQELSDDIYLRKLIMANAIMAGVIPFWTPINAGIVILNSGFILSQVARQIKNYLMMVNNQHYQQLGKFKKPQQYLRIILNNLLFMSINCIFLSFGYYTTAHLSTLAWYLFNVVSEFLPFSYWTMFFPILTVIMCNQLASALLKEIFPSEMEIISSMQETK